MQWVWLSAYSLAIGLLYYYLILPGLTKAFSAGRGGKKQESEAAVYAGSSAYFAVCAFVYFKIVKPRVQKKE